MTVKQFSEVAAGRIYLNDFGSSLSAVPGSVLFDAIKDCKICEIESRGGSFVCGAVIPLLQCAM